MPYDLEDTLFWNEQGAPIERCGGLGILSTLPDTRDDVDAVVETSSIQAVFVEQPMGEMPRLRAQINQLLVAL